MGELIEAGFLLFAGLGTLLIIDALLALVADRHNALREWRKQKGPPNA